MGLARIFAPRDPGNTAQLYDIGIWIAIEQSELPARKGARCILFIIANSAAMSLYKNVDVTSPRLLRTGRQHWLAATANSVLVALLYTK
jgi:hypothetical protein